MLPNSMKEARKVGHYFRFEPLKQCSALEFALKHGADLSLTKYIATAAPPRERQKDDLQNKPCAVFLCDQEGRQTHGRIACSSSATFGLYLHALAVTLCQFLSIRPSKGEVGECAPLQTSRQREDQT